MEDIRVVWTHKEAKVLQELADEVEEGMKGRDKVFTEKDMKKEGG